MKYTSESEGKGYLCICMGSSIVYTDTGNEGSCQCGKFYEIIRYT